MGKASGKFTVTGGGEQVVRDAPGEVKLTRANGTQRFDGDIVGRGSSEWVLCHFPGGRARFVGFQRIEGTIEGRAGSLVMESEGERESGRSQGRWRVISGSGTGDLAGIDGSGTFDAPGGPEFNYELEFDLG